MNILKTHKLYLYSYQIYGGVYLWLKKYLASLTKIDNFYHLTSNTASFFSISNQCSQQIFSKRLLHMLCWASYWENKGVGRASLCPSLHKQMQTRPQGLEMSSETEANIGLDALSPGASPRPPGGGEDSARGCLL